LHNLFRIQLIASVETCISLIGNDGRYPCSDKISNIKFVVCHSSGWMGDERIENQTALFFAPSRHRCTCTHTHTHTRVHTSTCGMRMMLALQSREPKLSRIVMVARLVTRNCHCHKARDSHSLAYIQIRTRVHTYELILRFRFTVMHRPVFTDTISLP